MIEENKEERVYILNLGSGHSESITASLIENYKQEEMKGDITMYETRTNSRPVNAQANRQPQQPAAPQYQQMPQQPQNRQPQQQAAPQYRQMSQQPQNRQPQQQAGQQYQQMSQQPQNRQPQQQAESNQPPANETSPRNDGNFISSQIWKVNGKDKVIDFTSNLICANLNDYANVHGRGGKGHAPNSTISVNLCDYTKGTGNASVSVRYNVDVEDMPILYQAAMSARMGTMPTPVPLDALNTLCCQLSALSQCPQAENNCRIVDVNLLRAIFSTSQQIYKGAVQPGAALFSFAREKNNPYATVKRDGQTFAPVSRIDIRYIPLRQDGKVSNYPWYVGIENYDAPLVARSNGATAHQSAHAINKKGAYINLATDAFVEAMVAVERFVRLWEQVTAEPIMRQAMDQIAAYTSGHSNG